MSRGAWARYRDKMRGHAHIPPRVGWAETGWSWLGALLGIGAVAGLGRWLVPGPGAGLLIGSFGASAVLVYGAVKSPLAQPRNLVGGHVLSAIAGVACQQVLGGQPELAAAVAVATAIALMHLTRTLHPPGGATALIAVIGGESVTRLGFAYAAVPVGVGALVLLAVAVVFNNLIPGRRYPEYWF